MYPPVLKFIFLGERFAKSLAGLTIFAAIFVAKVEIATAIMAILTNNLLELANSDVDTLFQNFDEIRIDEVLWNTRDEILKQKPECNINIIFEKITDNEELLMCKGKAKLLETAFLNIIDNACKFSKDKTVKIKVVSEKKHIIILFNEI